MSFRTMTMTNCSLPSALELDFHQLGRYYFTLAANTNYSLLYVTLTANTNYSLIYVKLTANTNYSLIYVTLTANTNYSLILNLC